MRRALLSIAAIFLGACTQQATAPRLAASAAAGETQLAQLATTAEYAPARGERLAAATAGMRLAQQFQQRHPQHPAGHYYHAVLTGLYHQIHIFGYQRGLASMLADCAVVQRLDERYADAGCYRMTGQIFTQLPQTAFRPGQLVRDLDRADTALQAAVRLAPRSFENQLALCEATLALGDAARARRACGSADQLLAAQRSAPGYAAWAQAVQTAKRQLTHE